MQRECQLLGPKASLRRRQWHPTPVFLPGKFHGRGSLVGCCRWGHTESDTTECLHFHFSLSCFGKGNGKPFQCSCLENPMDRGAWWATVHGVAKSRTRLKRLSTHIRICRLVCWRSLLRVLWTAKRSNQSILKEINPEYSLEGLLLEMKL